MSRVMICPDALRSSRRIPLEKLWRLKRHCKSAPRDVTLP
jgi:hypothetical protein